MDEYMKINQCIQLLKGSNLPTIKKLRVEIQLIQMKRLLLDAEPPVATNCGPCGHPVFEGLLSQIGRICHGSYDGSLTDQVERLSWMLSALGGYQSTSSYHHVPVESFPSHISGTA